MKAVVRTAPLAVLAAAVLAYLAPGVARADSGGRLAQHPIYVENVFETRYTQGCTGHDEPELDPLSNLAGSARDMPPASTPSATPCGRS